MYDRHLFTSESVTEGHPDKVADAISDAVTCDAISTATHPARGRVRSGPRAVGCVASRYDVDGTASEIASATLSGCPSVTDSDVKRWRSYIDAFSAALRAD